MKKVIVFSLLLLPFSFLISSCHSKKKAAAETPVTPEVKRDFEAEGYTKATVIFFELDACRYLLELPHEPNGPDVMKRLEPAVLAEEFKKDQLAVWVKYTVKKGAMSACQAGPVVDIADIQLRK